jgi:hypothetical protein
MAKKSCGNCLYESWDGELGTIQSCANDEVTFRGDGIEVEDKIYKWNECPLWQKRDFPQMPTIPF